uniref:TIDP3108 n=1 Tax=Arundo donax TaxID=35708 RepID=A0A0A9DWA0_ARUDO
MQSKSFDRRPVCNAQ